MEKGNISNEAPPRYLVNARAVTVREPRIRKVLGIFKVADDDISLDRGMLSRLWLLRRQVGITLELFSEDFDQDFMDGLMDLMDETGVNPFTYANAVPSLALFVQDLAWRPEVQGVIDVPEKGLVYGSKYFDIGRV